MHIMQLHTVSFIYLVLLHRLVLSREYLFVFRHSRDLGFAAAHDGRSYDKYDHGDE